MQTDPDIDLIQRIQNGDRSAEEELISRLRDRIRMYVSSFIHPVEDDLKDITSEIEMILLTNLRQAKFDPNRRTSAGTYAYGIARNKVREYLRAKKANKDRINDPVMKNSDVPDVTSGIENEDLRRVLRIQINQLKTKYRKVLYLRFFEEMSVSQISKLLNIPPHRVSERLNYALKLLQKRCQKKKVFSILKDMIQIY